MTMDDDYYGIHAFEVDPDSDGPLDERALDMINEYSEDRYDAHPIVDTVNGRLSIYSAMAWRKCEVAFDPQNARNGLAEAANRFNEDKQFVIPVIEQEISEKDSKRVGWYTVGENLNSENTAADVVAAAERYVRSREEFIEEMREYIARDDWKEDDFREWFASNDPVLRDWGFDVQPEEGTIVYRSEHLTIPLCDNNGDHTLTAKEILSVLENDVASRTLNDVILEGIGVSCRDPQSGKAMSPQEAAKSADYVDAAHIVKDGRCVHGQLCDVVDAIDCALSQERFMYQR